MSQRAWRAYRTALERKDIGQIILAFKPAMLIKKFGGFFHDMADRGFKDGAMSYGKPTIAILSVAMMVLIPVLIFTPLTYAMVAPYLWYSSTAGRSWGSNSSKLLWTASLVIQ